MKTTTLKPEHAIACRWLDHAERQASRGKPMDKISDPHIFRLHISEMEESGELRLNHREIDHAETVKIAKGRLLSGKWPHALLATLKHSDRRAISLLNEAWIALGSRSISARTASRLEHFGVVEKRLGLENALSAARYFGTEAEANDLSWSDYVDDVSIYYGSLWRDIPAEDKGRLKQAFEDGRKEERKNN